MRNLHVKIQTDFIVHSIFLNFGNKTLFFFPLQNERKTNKRGGNVSIKEKREKRKEKVQKEWQY